MTLRARLSKDQLNKETLQYTKQNNFIESGIDIENRIVFLDAEVDALTTSYIIRSVMLMDRLDPNTPIDFYINSFGGDVYSGLGVYDTLRNLNCTVRTTCTGAAMSMGLMLFLAGDERYCYENSTFMAHSVSSGSFGKVNDMEIDLAETKRLNELLIGILAERTKKNKKYWMDQTKHEDKYYNKKEAKKLGII